MPLTAETKPLIGPAEIARLKKGAILVNAARGGVVDEKALYEALRSGHLYGAGIDVFVTEPPRRGDWVYEVKHDGYRMLARLDGDASARIFTRAGNDWTGKLPRLAAALEKLALRNTWLDGEIVVPDPRGRSSFQALQNAFEAGRDGAIVYYVFDAPFLSGHDLRSLEDEREFASLISEIRQP